MMNLTYEEIVKKIAAEKNLSEEDVVSQVKEKLKKFSDLISKEGAAHILANELGVKIFDDARRRNVQIHKILPGMRNINVIGKVIKMYEVRSFKTKREGKVGSFLMADESGQIRVVMWDTNHISEIEKGNLKEDTIIKIDNVYIKENNGYKEIHVGSASKITLNPEGETVNVVKREMPMFAKADVKNIKELNENDNNVMIRGTVVQVFEPRFYQVCPQCDKKVIARGEGYFCEEHGNVKEIHVPILNVFFDDGTDNIRIVAFREQVLRLLNMTSEEVLNFRANPQAFENIKNNFLGSQFSIIGRVSKNDMFQRLEFIARRVEALNPEKLAEEMVSAAV